MGRLIPVAWCLAVKDVRLFLADRKAAVLAFAVPVVLAAAFGLVFTRPAGQMASPRLPVFVANHDGGPKAQAIIDALAASEHVELTVTDRETARHRAEQRVGVGLVLPAGFGRPTAPPVELMCHPLSAAEGRWAEGALTEAVMRQMAAEWLGPLKQAGMVTLDRPFDLRRVSPMPEAAPREFNAYAHSFCGMTLQYLLFWGMESGLLLLRERHRGIWQRLRAAAVPVPTLLLGKAFATAGLAAAQVVVTFAVGFALFGVRVSGSVVGFGLLCVAACGLAAATGLLVASLGGTEARARNGCIVVILGVSMLGGLWLPAFLLPTWVQHLAGWLPTGWAIRGFDGVTCGAMPLAPAAGCAAMVGGYAAAFLALAVWRFARIEALARRGSEV